MNGVLPSIVEDSCASVRPFIKGLVKNFRAGLNKPVALTFRSDSIGSQSDAHTAVDGITICFSEGATSDNGDGSSNGRNLVDLLVDPEIIELSLLFFLSFLFKIRFIFWLTSLVYRSLKTYYSFRFCFHVYRLCGARL